MSASPHDSSLELLPGMFSEAMRGASGPPMPTLDLNSEAPLPREIVEGPLLPRIPTSFAALVASQSADGRGPGELWLQGDALMCACPDCGAPMSVRIWLMIADCWNCGIAIELSEEQEREARRLLKELHERRQAETAVPIPVTESVATPELSAPVSEPASLPPAAVAPLPAAPPPPPASEQLRLRRRRAAAATRPVARLRNQTPAERLRRGLRQFLHDLPAWLVSAVFHLILLALLALMTLSYKPSEPLIVLSTSIDREPRPGEPVDTDDPPDTVEFDLPLDDPNMTEDVRRAEIQAEQDARQIRLDPDQADPNLADLDEVKRAVADPNAPYQTFSGRDPRLRVDLLKTEGGTRHTEAAVARALRWMAQYQNTDGSWSLNRFNQAPGAPGPSGNPGNIQSDSAATSLVLLAYLGAGQSHLTGIYKGQVSKGLRWLIQHQGENGDLRIDSQGNSGMYAHGQGAIVLCEALGMTQDEQLRLPAQRAIDFIVKAQHPRGGWRYSPGEEGDTSVVGWQLMALQSAITAGLNVPDATLELAGQYLDSVEVIGERGEALYRYQPNRPPTHVMTAEALLCRMYLGQKLDDPGMSQSVRYLVDHHLPASSGENAGIYYWYYATQVMHHVGGDPWKRWNLEMSDILVNTQVTKGPEAGSWHPVGQFSDAGGRIYMTALATCTLEIYYRHAPIFRRIKLE